MFRRPGGYLGNVVRSNDEAFLMYDSNSIFHMGNSYSQVDFVTS